MLSCLTKNIVPQQRPRQTKTVEKEAMQELDQDLARADDDGFAIAKKIKGWSFINKSR